ncbi:MAG: UDP-N-acetylmuramate dehydrogenase [Salinivirgaceae bacterium]|nr:UDP-N-acetylmuramate dehydrogenase [Salinivirgaceae bacterium]
MTKILENTSIKTYNTFGIDVKADFLCFYNSPADIKEIITNGPLHRDTEMIILGGGSNQLFTSDFKGVLVHPVNDFIERVEEDDDHIFLKVGAGCNWDKFVEYAVSHGYGGIENLSDIPGNVGAAPVQNIGAYGVEAKDSIYKVHVVSFHDGSEKTMSNEECKFAYRNSIFKSDYKNKYLVDSVTFKLNKKPEYISHYGTIEEELKKFDEINLTTIRQAIINIRSSKLPKPEEIGSAGSFFKNPVITSIQAEQILKKFPDMPTYPGEKNMTKVAAGWLIEQCGLKGFINKKGTAGIHDKQALVIVNKGEATGADIVEIAQMVQSRIFEKFNICLEPEVIIL